MAKLLRSLKINRVDLVDRGANPDANVVLFKRDDDDDDLHKQALTTAAINDLPDSAFAVIRPGGRKDSDGKTIPRALRSLPFKTANGSIDLPRLRNALARISQTDLTSAQRTSAATKLRAAARQAQIGEFAKDEETIMDLDKLRALLKPEPTTLAFTEKFSALWSELDGLDADLKKAEHLDTFDDVMTRRNLQRVMGKINDLMMGLFETVDRVTNSDHAEKARLVKDAIKAFTRRVGTELPRFVDDTMHKAGGEASGERLARLKKIEALTADTIREGEGDMEPKDKKTEPVKPDMGAMRKMFAGFAKMFGATPEQVAEIDPETGDDIWKGVSPALRTRIEASEAATTAEVKKREEAEKRVTALEVEKAMAQTTEELKGYTNLGLDPVKDAELFRQMTAGMNEEQVKRTREIFKGAEAKIATGKIYGELGAAGHDVPTDSATAEVDKRVNALQAKAETSKLTDEEAMQRVFQEDDALYERYRRETNIKV